jgi:hypothetical protein
MRERVWRVVGRLAPLAAGLAIILGYALIVAGLCIAYPAHGNPIAFIGTGLGLLVGGYLRAAATISEGSIEQAPEQRMRRVK